MLRIPCPKCHKTSYTSDVESFYSCNHCGFIFSGKYGPDRRRESRIEKVISLVFSYQDRYFEAHTFDLSEKGVGIKISGEPPMTIGDVLSFIIGDLSIMAKVKWVKRLSDGALAGLQRLN